MLRGAGSCPRGAPTTPNVIGFQWPIGLSAFVLALSLPAFGAAAMSSPGTNSAILPGKTALANDQHDHHDIKSRDCTSLSTTCPQVLIFMTDISGASPCEYAVCFFDGQLIYFSLHPLSTRLLLSTLRSAHLPYRTPLCVPIDVCCLL